MEIKSPFTSAIRIGDAVVSFVERIESIEDRDFKGNATLGNARRFRIALPAEPAILADVISWDRRSADGAIGQSTPQYLEGREHEGCPRNYSHRLGVYRHPRSTLHRPLLAQELRLLGPKIGRPEQMTLRMTTLDEIEAAARVEDVRAILRECGADAIDRRERIGWGGGRRDNQLAMTFEQSSVWAPIAALVLCVVLPVHHGLV